MPQVNITMGKATITKLDALKAQYGSRSQVVAVAVDRLWMMECMPEVAEPPQQTRDAAFEQRYYAKSDALLKETMNASELWDRFASEADPAQLAMMSVQDVAEQVNELRGYEVDRIKMTDARIASTLILYAQDMIQEQDADNA